MPRCWVSRARCTPLLSMQASSVSMGSNQLVPAWQWVSTKSMA